MKSTLRLLVLLLRAPDLSRPRHGRTAGSLAVFVAAALPTVANAAEITVVPPRENMPAIIAVSGAFEFGDEKRFVDAVLGISRAIVILNSEGGNLHAALEIGRAIRLKGFETIVGDNVICASGCALVWLAGTPRTMAPRAMIGFHAASDRERNIASSGNALVGSYLNQLGLSSNAVIFITAARPESMSWLTFDLASQLGIDIRRFDLTPSTPSPPIARQPAPTPAPPPANVSLRDTVVTFLNRHYQSFNQDSYAVSAYINRTYSDVVTYFGNPRTRQQIVDENMSFISRWPARSYSVRPAQTHVSCTDYPNQCTINAVVDWTAYSAERKISSTGASSIEMVIDFSTRTPRIVREKGTVLHRNVSRH
ncbi:MAG: hypothetical protein JNK84_06940 [Phreatobacter sp.]|uniref:COG3904 family protein n=1 Tax=Phreatobacter sp. TaxID=1966341 RepID=UPI001A4B5555|nr:hypothetical protein [Phreatobacter sp.]MBL8568807.1 hypothetical protein [Phreatobacter sp.]